MPRWPERPDLLAGLPAQGGAALGGRRALTDPVEGITRMDLRREPVSSEVARALLDYIFSGRVGPGERLPSERQLAESFGVGRSVIREALKSLGLLGLVEFRQGGGTYLRAADSELLPRVIEWGLLLGESSSVDLVEARQHLEVATATLAAQRRSPADLQAIKDRLDAMGRAESPDAFVEADVAFHLSIARASGNRVLANMLGNISSLLHVWIRRVIDNASSTEPSYREHIPIYDAIAAQDVPAAALCMEKHMSGAAARLRAALDEHHAAHDGEKLTTEPATESGPEVTGAG